jgi:ubiquinone/menaquinone biosynthesis C-methylase UbiE
LELEDFRRFRDILLKKDFFEKEISAKFIFFSRYLLDAGCGTGSYMVEYAGKVGKIECMDFSEGMLEQTEKRLNNKGKFKILCVLA